VARGAAGKAAAAVVMGALGVDGARVDAENGWVDAKKGSERAGVRVKEVVELSHVMLVRTLSKEVWGSSDVVVLPGNLLHRLSKWRGHCVDGDLDDR